MDRQRKIPRNFDNPPFKDTTLVPPGGYLILRFYADNPGFWLMHCHVDYHADVGMDLIIQVGNQHDLPLKPSNWPQC